jgi:hypothetical protein
MMIVLSAFAGGMYGQEAKPQELKRWHFTSQVGLHALTFHDSNTGFNEGGVGLNGSGLILTELGYRLHRHLDVGIQVGFQRESSSGFKQLTATTSDFLSFRTSFDCSKLSSFIGLQTKLNYRIGQGDLSLSGAYGFVLQGNRVRARSPNLFTAELRMAELTYNYFSIGLGYTYWATPRFGVILGYTLYSPQIGNLRRNVEISQNNTASYVFASSEVEGVDITEAELSSFRGRVSGNFNDYITIGLTARIF